MFVATEGGRVDQTEIWKMYQETFSAYSKGEHPKPLVASELVKQVGEVFPSSCLKSHHQELVVEGIERRHETQPFSLQDAGHRPTTETLEAQTVRTEQMAELSAMYTVLMKQRDTLVFKHDALQEALLDAVGKVKARGFVSIVQVW